ncbi:MAG TPA: DUF2142 domain-containing protein [Allosphingosinicella sp.]
MAERTEKIVFAATCAAILLFVFITPPFQAPDEDQHWYKAVLLSQGRLLAERQGELTGAVLPRDAIELPRSDFPRERPGAAWRASPSEIARAWSGDAERSGTAFVQFPNLANYSPSLYLPQAAGIVTADAIGLPRLGGFYLGRLFNAFAAIALLGLAVAAMPCGRPALLAAAALPTFAFQAGSLSADASINGFALLALALSLRLGDAAHRKVWPLLAAAPFLGLAKGVYLPVLVSGLRWPTNARDRRFWMFAAAAVIAAAAFLAWMLYSGGEPSLYTTVSRKTGLQATTAPMADQLAIILADPLQYVRILLGSFTERFPVYVLQIVGRPGWNAFLLPLLAYPVAGLMIAAALCSGGGPRATWGQRLWWLLLAVGGAMLVETALYLTGTPYAADYVQGVQGRYFLPLLPLLLLAVMPQDVPQPWQGRARRVFAGSASLLLAVGLLSALDSFWLHGFATVEGMPPIGNGAGGAARGLLLPSPRW